MFYAWEKLGYKSQYKEELSHCVDRIEISTHLSSKIGKVNDMTWKFTVFLIKGPDNTETLKPGTMLTEATQ